MKKWVLKAVVQKVISFLPYRNKINFLFQKYVTKGVYLSDEYFGFKIDHLSDHIAHIRSAKDIQNLQGLACLELGTGWYPVIPIGFFLLGAEKVCTVDISPLLKHASFLTCIQTMLDKRAFIEQEITGTLPERWAVLEQIAQQDNSQLSLEALCSKVHLEVKVADARQLPFEANSFDLISSNNTFEHIYPEVLKGIVQELWRLTRPEGIMSHFIDMSDHFAHLDKSITIYNFLQYSEKAWNRIDNAIQPQNRWRLPQHQALYDQLGVPYETKGIRPGSLEDLRSVKVDSSFSKYTEAELAISHAYLVSKK